MKPSLARTASIAESGSVLPDLARPASPTSCVSKTRPRENFLSRCCRTRSVAAVISGPMPSPGRTGIFTRLLERLQGRHHVAREALHVAAGEVGGQRAELAHHQQVAEAHFRPEFLEGGA